MATDRLYIEWLDQSAQFIRTANYVATPAGVGAYLTALQAISNAGEIVSTEGPANFLNHAAVDAQYPSSLDTAVLLYATAAGRIRVTVPAPKSSIFLADQLTADPIALAPFTAAVVGALGDTLGNPILTFVQGVRASRRKDVE